MKYKIFLPLLVGAGFVSLLVLLLNVHSLLMSVAASALLFPGGALSDVFFKNHEFTSPVLVLAANALLYSVIALIIIFGPLGKLGTGIIRRVTVSLAIPAAASICLACIPAFNPLWPRGITEMITQEKALQESFPLGVRLDAARAVLRSKGIELQENTETNQTVIVDGGKDGRITAASGDHVISARLQTEARVFPCSYDIQLVLVFGQDERMRQQFIHRLRLCP